MMDNYYLLNVINVSQLSTGTGGVFTGKLTFKELLTIHRLTERKESTFDPFGIKQANYQALEDQEFQRHLSEKKLVEIKKYLSGIEKGQSSRTLFPSAVIISLDLNEDNSDTLKPEDIEKLYTADLDSCFVTKSILGETFSTIYLPKNKRLCLIVDGQHRFYGLRRYYESLTKADKEIVDNFEFITTILVGFDPYEVAEVFANVNFHQKPVNRSLYYDIFGSSSSDRNEIQLAHFLVLHLQNNADSPLCNMIKLLGKGYGLFSQAFLVKKMLVHFTSGGAWEELFEDYKNNGKRFLGIAEFIKIYFRSIEANYNSCWPEMVAREVNGKSQMVYSPFAYPYILCKTTGMGAFLRLIKEIYPKVSGLDNEQMRVKIDTILSKISSQEAKILFSKQGEFGGGGSEGLQLKLYRQLRDKLGLI